MDFLDYYAYLGVPRFYATQDEIREAYLKQVRFFHPDAGNVPPNIATDRTQVLNHIYAVLRDPQKKRAYDEQLAANIKMEEARQKQTEMAEKAEKEQQERAAQERIRAKKKRIAWICCIALAVIIGFVVSYFVEHGELFPPAASQGSTNTPRPTSTPRPASTPKPTANLIPVTRPANGTIFTGSGLSRVAPLTIKTSGSQDYYVKLVSDSTGKTVMAFYVRGGSSVDIDVPLGTYKLRYATGSTWYGTRDLFGADTSYCEADDTFCFGFTGKEYVGWTVSLTLQYQGNLDVDNIDASDF